MKRGSLPYSLIISLLLTVVPVAAGLLYALAYSLGLAGILSEGFTLHHWRAVCSDGGFYFSIGFSLYIAVVSIGIATCLALLLVLKYNTGWLVGGRRFTISLPLVFPAIITAFIIMQWCSKSGILARLAFAAGLLQDVHRFPDLINDRFGFGIIAAHVLMATPFFTLLFAGVYQAGRLAEYRSLSASLGATPAQFYRRVALPVLLRQALPALVLYLIFVTGAYEIPLLLGRSYPQMLSVYATDKLSRFDLLNRPQAYVVSIVFTCLVMALLAFVFYLRKKTAHEA